GVNAARGLLPVPGEDALRIAVTGHQWWWEVRYPQGVITANQLILPVGRPVDIEVASADVIHAFWVPSLGGKLDMTPGRQGRLRLHPAREGALRGQCAEFSGTQHAHMILHVEVLPEAELHACPNARAAQPPVAPPAGAAGEGVAGRWRLCDRVAGVGAGGRAPDVADLASRRSVGAGVSASAAAGLRRSLREPQRLKRGNGMPDHDPLDEATREVL